MIKQQKYYDICAENFAIYFVGVRKQSNNEKRL